jgi:dienelactone hydrolase
LDVKVHESVEVEGVYRRDLISYQVEADDRAWAYLAVPTTREKPAAAVIALHGTGVEGKDIVAGFVDRPGHGGTGHLDFLARRGYIVLAPDLFNMGQRLPANKIYHTDDFYKKHPKWSALGKIVYDGAAAIDVLLQRPDVDPDRLGAIGHSLGGMGSLYLAAYDERIRAAVCIHGSVTFRFNADVAKLARPELQNQYVFFDHLRDDLLHERLPPIDTHHILSLIAPRAFLDVVSVNDPYNGTPYTHRRRVLMDLAITDLYAIHGVPEKFSFYVIGQRHAFEHDARELSCAWLDKHLTMTRARQPQAKARTSHD